MPLRVLLADDHPIYREGLVDAFGESDDLDVVAECRDGEEALERLRSDRPDVAVLDQKMSGLDAWEIVERARAEGIETRILVLSAYADADLIARTLELGADGYLSKDADRSEICNAVRTVAGGGTVIGSDLQRLVVQHLRESGSRARSLLSDREAEVLVMLAEGLTSGQIADRLVLSPATVKTHLHNLYEKLGASGAAAAVAEAMRRGLLR